MKIAIVTDDGQSISAHFGRARAYAVLTVRDGAVVERELRPKSAPHLDPQNGHDDADASHDGPAAHARHDQMIAPISDCECLIAGGMGRGAFDRITAAGFARSSPIYGIPTRLRSHVRRARSRTWWIACTEAVWHRTRRCRPSPRAAAHLGHDVIASCPLLESLPDLA